MLIIKNITVALYIASITGNEFNIIKGDKEGQANFEFDMLNSNYVAKSNFDKAYKEFKMGYKDDYLDMKKKIDYPLKNKTYSKVARMKANGEL